MSDAIKTMPMVPLRSQAVLPTMLLHFEISREESIRAVELAMAGDQKIFLVAQKNPEMEQPELESLYEIGVTAEVHNVIKLSRDIVRVMAEGKQKCRLLALNREEGCWKAQIHPVQEAEITLQEPEKEGMKRALCDLVERYAQVEPKAGRNILRQLMEQPDFSKLVTAAATQLPFSFRARQHLLEQPDLLARYQALCILLAKETQILQIRSEVQRKVKEKVEKTQRDYVLREQLKVIQEELGENTFLSDLQKYQEQLEALTASAEVKEKIQKEIHRLKAIGSNSAEAAVTRGYVETLLALPWKKKSKDNMDLRNARKVLEEDHYGLEKVKERILEFLAVRCLNHRGDSPILCLAGPPGTGKTSIARSIARALNKEYVRISLGGVHDEAEIRGHRRTYVGAMPGRIAAGLRQAGVANPLMLLDEIDKVGSDYHGDTSSALLEVLDSEQNSRFQDHYVELPLDLSEVLFLATANDLHTIARPLLDRMEIIEISSYTSTEKLHIAREHLMPKQLERHGLSKSQLTITKPAMTSLIDAYTREAGVRQLERKIGEICRKAAKEILEEKTKRVRVSEKTLERYLGKRRYAIKKKNEENETGIVRGLAWTSVGGETLEIEVNTMPGKGEFVLTGQMGDVMKESARTAVSYVRSIAERYGTDAEFFTKNDIHIHIPEGAVPKDGPSAGITMAAAILSAVSGIPARADVAMTGEITLRGRVLPIGGLKEKLLAAKKAGILTVLVPEENRTDVEEISEEILDGLKIRYVERMTQVLQEVLVVNPEKTKEQERQEK